MATTEILPFGSGGTGSPNVLSQSAYATFLSGLTGNSYATGAVPTSQQWNKIMRQSSFVTAGIANWMVSMGISVPDDGDLATFVEKLALASTSYLDKSVAGGSDVTLNAVTEANYQTIDLFGTLTNNINIIVPTAVGRWLFNNGTIGGSYTVTIKTTGGTGVVIPRGTSMWVWCDATNTYSGNQPAIAVGQTWQDMTASRAMDVVYYNTTGKPIIINIEVWRNAVSTAGWGCSVNGGAVIPVAMSTNSSGGNRSSGNIIIPGGSSYKCTITTEAASVTSWFELR